MSESNPPVQEPPPARHGSRGCAPHRRPRTLWFSEEEWQQIRAAAERCGKPPSCFVRDTSLGARFTAVPLLVNAELIRELGRSGTALSRLAASAKATGALPEATSLEAALASLCDLVRQIGVNLTRQAPK
jgi:hypothetical protein